MYSDATLPIVKISLHENMGSWSSGPSLKDRTREERDLRVGEKPRQSCILEKLKSDTVRRPHRNRASKARAECRQYLWHSQLSPASRGLLSAGSKDPKEGRYLLWGSMGELGSKE